MFGKRNLLLKFIAIVLVGSQLIAAVPAQINVGTNSDTVSTESTSLAKQKQIMKMWTPAEFLAAQPAPVPAFPEPAQAEPDYVGQPGFSQAGAPQLGADIEAGKQFPSALLDTVDLSLDENIDGTAAVYDYYKANYYSQMWKYGPYYTIGKLYFKDIYNNSYYCTATVISPNNIIVTAGHCAYDRTNARWYKNWVFIPAYRNTAAPYGSFPYIQGRVLTNYQTYGYRRYDVSVFSLGNNSAGRPVTYYVGWAGRSWNYGYVQLHHTLGYASNITQEYTSLCAAESFYDSADLFGMGCNMTYGSSGGPWMRNFQPYRSGAVNYVNGVVSGGTPGTNTFYGPRFSDYNIVLLCNAQGC